MAAASGHGVGVGLPGELDRINHDLRGPLNAALINMQVLKSICGGSDDARRSLDAVERQLRHLLQMIELALSVVSLERERDEPVDLRAVVEQVVREHAAGRVSVLGESWPDVRGDRALIALAVEHLVRNAIEATDAAGPGKPRPQVTLVTDGKMAVLKIRDRGVGFANTNPRAVIRLAASTKRGGEGTGLLTVERIARLHGGTLAFESRAGGGTDVHLSLPLA
jgi:signal transduction histidine kinase